MDDFEIYQGKNFSELVKDIVLNSENKKNQIDILVSELRSMMTGVNEAIMIVPLIKEYLDVGVKNDEQLVKLSAVLQRFMNTKKSDNGADVGLTEEEKKQLFEEVGAIVISSKTPVEVNKVSKK